MRIAATALTAVGPTYLFPVIQALKDGAVAKGLAEEQARFAVAQTIAGTAELVVATGQEPDVLKLQIGTRTLDEVQARAIMTAAFEAAFARISAAANKLTG
jgi:pyrroline-5-carboxylate reductase